MTVRRSVIEILFILSRTCFFTHGVKIERGYLVKKIQQIQELIFNVEDIYDSHEDLFQN